MARIKNASMIGIIADPTNTKIEDCLFFRKVHCDICGKEFETDTTMHQWKRYNGHGNAIIYCSYGCYRKWEKPFLEKNKKEIRKAMKEALLYDENGNKLEDRRGRKRRIA